MECTDAFNVDISTIAHTVVSVMVVVEKSGKIHRTRSLSTTYHKCCQFTVDVKHIEHLTFSWSSPLIVRANHPKSTVYRLLATTLIRSSFLPSCATKDVRSFSALAFTLEQEMSAWKHNSFGVNSLELELNQNGGPHVIWSIAIVSIRHHNWALQL